ncbi:MAG: type II secretion system protein [Desulfobacteraceae bacterium]|jgi:prepilin-type N-terminal cleavage/methylation domain-containing protein
MSVLLKKTKFEEGFTLLEIVIVLTIIGFLLAMIAPRLGDIGNSAVEKIDESNIKELRGYLTVYEQRKSRLPNKLITIVNSKGGGDFQKPLVDDSDADNGPETIGYEFNERCRLQLHILNEKEADEIKKMGIRKILVLNDYDGSTNSAYVKNGKDSDLEPQTFASGDEGRPMNLIDVDEGVGVLMIGAGADSKDGKIDTLLKKDENVGNPAWLYRIVLGFGRDSSLVTEGIVQNEGLSPKGMQNADYNTYNNYCLVLPRLKSTVERMAGGTPKTLKISNASFDEDDEKAEQRVIGLDSTQEIWEADVCSPSGYTWPQDAVSMWEIVDVAEKF